MEIIKKIFLTTLSMGLLASCSSPSPIPSKTEYLVNFNTSEGSFIPAQRVEENQSIRKPANPIREDYTFEYWECDGKKFTDEDFAKPVTSDITLKAVWSGGPAPEEGYWLVSFDSDGGSYVPAQVIKEGEHATKPANPTRTEGTFVYEFGGWFYNGTKFEFDKTPIMSSITLVARWNGTPPVPKNYHIVDFDSDGGSYIPARRVEHNTAVNDPGAPTKIIEGFAYTFEGWFNGAIKFDFAKTPITDNLTLKAHWSGSPKVYYTVTFESNGGTHIEPTQVEENAILTEPTTPVKPDGSTFSGWYENAAFSGDAYDFSKGVTKSFTLYAKWVDPAVMHTVTFVMNGATSEAINPVNVEDGKTISEPAIPTKSGYSFKGWCIDESLTSIFVFTTAITKDLILYAKWGDLKTYAVEFYDGDTKISGYDQTVNYGERVQRPENPTKEDFAFSGWYKDSALKDLYTFDDVITSLEISTIKIYAKWDNTMFAVSFASNGGSIVPSQNVKSGATIETSPTTTYTGHTFDGWYTDDGTFKVPFKFGTLEEGATQVKSAIVLYAKWTLNKITVTIDYNYEGSSPKEISVDYGATIPMQDVPVREYYNFIGWYDAAEDGNVWDPTKKITSSITIYAHWKFLGVDVFVVFFYPNGGNLVGDECYKAVYKGQEFATMQKPVAVSSTGTFNCWSLQPTAIVTPTTITSDTVVYAIWDDTTQGVIMLAPDPWEQQEYWEPIITKAVNNLIVDPDKTLNKINQFEVKEGHTFKGFAYTNDRAHAGNVDFTVDQVRLPLPDDFPATGYLYPVFTIDNYSITFEQHGATPFDPTPIPGPYNYYYEFNAPTNFTYKDSITIEISLHVLSKTVPVYYIPSFASLDNCFLLKCDGEMTDVTLTLDDEPTYHWNATITIAKATGNIKLDTWLYKNPEIKSI